MPRWLTLKELESDIEPAVEDMLSDRGEIYEGGSLSTYPGSARATISNDATLDSFITELVDPDIHPWTSHRWCGTVTRTWCGTSCVLRRILRDTNAINVVTFNTETAQVVNLDLIQVT